MRTIKKKNFKIKVSNSDYDLVNKLNIYLDSTNVRVRLSKKSSGPNLGKYLLGETNQKKIIFRNGNKLDFRRTNIYVVDSETKEYKNRKAREYAYYPTKRFYSLKHRCKQSNKKFNIAFKTYLKLINSPCVYCGCSIYHSSGSGLDRINNNLGYTTKNVLPCCGTCNGIRSNKLTVDEMKIAMAAVVRFRNSK